MKTTLTSYQIDRLRELAAHQPLCEKPEDVELVQYGMVYRDGGIWLTTIGNELLFDCCGSIHPRWSGVSVLQLATNAVLEQIEQYPYELNEEGVSDLTNDIIRAIKRLL